MYLIGDNIKYLRRKSQQSQQDLADKLSIPRSSLSDYERGYTQISIDNLVKIAEIFDVSLDELIRSNLSHKELEIIKSDSFKVLAISVDNNNRSNIELVETKAAAGYLSSYSNPEYIKELPKLYIPKIPQGTYRGFEIRGDSMLPIESGSIIICSYIENLKSVKNDKTYIVISKTEGVVYKRVKIDFDKQKLILISDNELYLPYGMDFEQIDEIWQYYAHISFNDSKVTFNQLLEDKINDIQRKVTIVHNALQNPQTK